MKNLGNKILLSFGVFLILVAILFAASPTANAKTTQNDYAAMALAPVFVMCKDKGYYSPVNEDGNDVMQGLELAAVGAAEAETHLDSTTLLGVHYLKAMALQMPEDVCFKLYKESGLADSGVRFNHTM